MVHASDIRLMGFIPCPFFLEVPQFTISEFIHFVTRSECEKLFILWAKPKRFFILKLGQKGRLLFCFRLLRGYALKDMVHASDRVNEVYPVPFFS